MATQVTNQDRSKRRKVEKADDTSRTRPAQDKNDIIVDSDEEAEAGVPMTTTTESSSVSSDTSSSSGSSDSEIEIEKTTTNGTSKAAGIDASDKSSVVSTSDDEESTAKTPETNQTNTARPRDATAAASGPRRPVHYKPPEGFKYIPIRDTPPVLSESAITGNETWHITAPVNIPISKITQVTLDNIRQNQVVLSHDGTGYTLTEDQHANAHLLLPSNHAAGYVAVETPLTKTLHLRQRIQLPQLSSSQAVTSHGSDAAAHIDQMPISRAKVQPKGLRMRYKPPGFGAGRAGVIGSESDESDTAVVNNQDRQKSKKRKADEHATALTPRISASAKGDTASAVAKDDDEKAAKAARKEERRRKRAAKEERRKSEAAA